MLNFQRPLSFFLLLLLPAFVLLRRTGRLQAVSISLPLGNWNGFVPEKNLRVYFAHRISQYTLAAAFVFAVAALAEPVRQTSEAMYAGSGQALMFVIDTSPSMAAQDMGTQTRLEAAKQIIKSFAEKYEGDSLGLTDARPPRLATKSGRTLATSHRPTPRPCIRLSTDKISRYQAKSPLSIAT